jgi:DNA-directed RNA polymerase subunit RPC12/RpoP
MILCPTCGSDRLIPLSFAQEQSVPGAGEKRPLVKCATCGQRIHAAEITADEQGSSK